MLTTSDRVVDERGRVSDASGAAAVRAKMRLENMRRGFNQETTTNDEGRFQFSNLPFETYTLIVSQSGFAEVSKQIGLRSTVLAETEISLAAAGASERETSCHCSKLTKKNQSLLTVPISRKVRRPSRADSRRKLKAA